MGLLIKGEWHDQWYDTQKTGGKFVRSESQFRNWVTRDGAPGPSGQGGFKAESGRYHLYVSLACPWAHRTLIMRTLKRLEPHIGVTVVDPHMLEHGWAFTGNLGSDLDNINGHDYLHQLYTHTQPDYSGRVTVPVLWDKQGHTIVNNESAEIIRMFNDAFSSLTDADNDFYPEALRRDIDEINAFVYENINNGVYRCGFATEQSAYDEAFEQLFGALDELEARLARQRYVVGARLTEADWRLFTTLVRFDAVYYSHFKCNQRRIADYQNLGDYLRELYQVGGIQDTVNMTHIKQHYYYSQTTVNPTRIVPRGPALDFMAPHNRDRLDNTKKRKFA
ncbi:glutathionyl-hydroquinone reductase YqjG [Candidatus Tenderia electrophaga]|mgnify:CR=1 FL=1|jgi:putative glutathione S-transferase|uniref:Glutathionyl-hydroquinone reductase YqjG n=1 Tax=Candidatus Tenderia electrophaga TaxID=1748243 RepID=A0A0S2TH44_9GAMM|nr:glutathionyl-hydroquinone reductase YqjG [Candidatus Tenderia electrophaga]